MDLLEGRGADVGPANFTVQGRRLGREGTLGGQARYLAVVVVEPVNDDLAGLVDVVEPLEQHEAPKKH